MGLHRSLLIGLFSLLASTGASATPVDQDDQGAVSDQLKNQYFDAARRGDVEMLNVFIESNYALNVQDPKGYSSLMMAAYHGHLVAVERLVDAGVNPCLQDKLGNTAFMAAIFKGETQIAKRLLDTACNADQRNEAGQTAAMHAALFERTELLQALEDWGADMEAEDAFGNSPARLLSGEIHTAPPDRPDRSR
jgi:ankyrin repeat protein